jgi:hypothetical protein
MKLQPRPPGWTGEGGRQESCLGDPPPGGDPTRALNDWSGHHPEAQSQWTKTKVHQKAGAEGYHAWDEGPQRK